MFYQADCNVYVFGQRRAHPLTEPVRNPYNLNSLSLSNATRNWAWPSAGGVDLYLLAHDLFLSIEVKVNPR